MILQPAAQSLYFFHIFISDGLFARTPRPCVIFNVFSSLLKAFVLLITSWVWHGVIAKAFLNVLNTSLHLIPVLTQHLKQILLFDISPREKSPSTRKYVLLSRSLNTKHASQQADNWHIRHWQNCLCAEKKSNNNTSVRPRSTNSYNRPIGLLALWCSVNFQYYRFPYARELSECSFYYFAAYTTDKYSLLFVSTSVRTRLPYATDHSSL